MMFKIGDKVRKKGIEGTGKITEIIDKKYFIKWNEKILDTKEHLESLEEGKDLIKIGIKTKNKDFEKVKIEKLPSKARRLLFKALEININNLRCYYCQEKLDYKTCGIMPPLNKKEKARITCDSPICIVEYIEDFEK